MKKRIKKSSNSYRHGNLREAIMQTSLKLIAKDGADNLSIRKVAELVGVTHQAPYRHFKDRDALLVALAVDGLDKLLTEIEAEVAAVSAPGEKLHKVGEGYMNFAIKFPDLFRLIFSKAVTNYNDDPVLSQSIERVLMRLLQIIGEVAKQGSFGNYDLRSVARQFWAVVHGVTILFIDGQFRPLAMSPEAGKKLLKEMGSNLIQGMKMNAAKSS